MKEIVIVVEEKMVVLVETVGEELMIYVSVVMK